VPEAEVVEELLLLAEVAVAAALFAQLEAIVPMRPSWLAAIVLERGQRRPEQEPEHTPSGSHREPLQLQEVVGVVHKQPLVVASWSTAEAIQQRCC
jgi:hypothetical protein